MVTPTLNFPNIRNRVVFTVIVLYVLRTSSAQSSDQVVSHRFERRLGLRFQCNVSEEVLLAAPVDLLLSCATACASLTNCKSFNIISAWEKPNSCSFCPAQNITDLMFGGSVANKTHSETWLRRAARYIYPAEKQELSAPGALEVGTLVVVKGTAPTTMPRKFAVDFYNKEQGVKTLVLLRFVRFVDTTNFIRANSKVDGNWITANQREAAPGLFPFAEGEDFEISLHPLEGNGIPGIEHRLPTQKSKVDGKWITANQRDAAPGLFPFAEGEDYEINVLTTAQGYKIYVNGVYVMTYDVSIATAGLADAIMCLFSLEVTYISY
ncbi:hypothetical protein EGW08_017962 [Elysia chlorotica]|uniref:Galectin n=1 Tax=Elysia chlorotica TaxID=188477 RepID=A0A3S0ZC34_ELYCH|nr:hypothetical protein EGW08_017962 [Elysia chlorotica]